MGGNVIIFVLIGIGFAAGILGGMTGVGGGIVMVPLLALIGFSQHQSQGMSLATMLPPVTLLAVVNYAKEGHLNWKYTIIMSLAFLIGGYLGSKLAISINEKTLKQVFGVIMLVMAIKMISSK